MPTPRKPTEVLELNGAFKKNPNRRRPVGAKAEAGIGDAPEWLSTEEAACWAELVECAPLGVLTSAERWILEIACWLMAKRRGAGICAAETGQLVKCLAMLGLSAVDRSKVSAPPPPEAAPSEFDEFIN